MKPTNYLKVAQVAARTGLTERAVYNSLADGSLVAHGGRNGIPADAVDEFIVNRQLTAAAKVGDPTRFAEQVRRRLQQPGGTRETHTQLDKDARDVFGPHVIRAAGMKEGRGCRWCWARMTASVHGGLKPVLDDAHRALLGEPCHQDLKAIRAEVFARHHKPDQTPADTTTQARAAAAKPKTRPSPHTSDQPGSPRRQDNGSDLTTTRRTALTASLQGARDRGDHKHARQLQSLLSALGPQAVRTPKPKAKPPRRSEPHSCGCQCERHRSQP